MRRLLEAEERDQDEPMSGLAARPEADVDPSEEAVVSGPLPEDEPGAFARRRGGLSVSGHELNDGASKGPDRD